MRSRHQENSRGAEHKYEIVVNLRWPGIFLALGSTLVANVVKADAIVNRLSLTALSYTQYDLVAQGGLACDGTTDDGPKIVQVSINLRDTYPATTPIKVMVPSGRTCLLATCTLSGSPYYSPLFHGFRNLRLSFGAGASFKQTGTGCSEFGNNSLYEGEDTKIAQFLTVSAGANCVTMVTAGQESRFAAGNWTMASGVQLQYTGYPPNFAVFEYIEVSSINTSTHQVCFATSLQHSYESTWPLYDQDPGSGGPATLYLMQPDWSYNFVVDGGNWQWGSDEFQWLGGNVTVNNAIVSSGTWSVAVAKSVILNNLTQGGAGTSEVDKDVDQITFNGGSVVNNLSFQSASIRKVSLNGISIDNLEGTTQDTECNGARIGDLVAGTSYGESGPFHGINCNIGKVSHVALNAYGTVVNGSGRWSMSGGVFTNAISAASPPRWGVPGTNMVWNGLLDYEGHFTIRDISEADPNFSVSTSLSGSLPMLPLEAGTGNLIIVADPYPSVTCSNCTGSPDAADMSQAGAQNEPLYTYSNRIYTCTNNIANIQAANPGVPVVDFNDPPSNLGPEMWGTFDSLSVDVLRPDTGAASPVTFFPNNQFGIYVINPAGSEVTWGSQVINLKITGARTITPSGASGAQSGDTLSSPGEVTLGLPTGPNTITGMTSELASRCAVVQVTWQSTRSYLLKRDVDPAANDNAPMWLSEAA